MKKNDQIVNELVSLRSSMTALVNKKNNLLHSQIETKYFTDLRFGEMIREMEEIARYLESVLEDMKSLRELFTIKRRIDMKREREKRFGWFNQCDEYQERPVRAQRGILTEKNNMETSETDTKKNQSMTQSAEPPISPEILSASKNIKGNPAKKQNSTLETTSCASSDKVKQKPFVYKTDIGSTTNMSKQETHSQSKIENHQSNQKKSNTPKIVPLTPKRASFGITKKQSEVTQLLNKTISDGTKKKNKEKFNNLVQSLIKTDEPDVKGMVYHKNTKKKNIVPKRIRKK